MKYALFSVIAASVLLTACEKRPHINKAQYWQRSSISDAAYQQGPKAQEMLNRGIANCVAELKELERIGVVRNAIPADSQGRILSKDELAYARYESPDRFGGLNIEESNYHDFEGCMMAKGWERTQFVPYHVADRSRKTYLKSIGQYDYYEKYGAQEAREREAQQAPNADLNQ